MGQEASQYVGRFAPSPTGPLHFGSLVAAVASYEDAREHGGRWLVRIEDVDEGRTVPGAADAILKCLAAYGMTSDAPVVYQTQRKHLYQAALEALGTHAFGCACTRSSPGPCRCGIDGLPEGTVARSWKVRADGVRISFTDRIHGEIEETLSDFVVRRADGYFAYQLAVVVDDADQGVTDVVRGEDLLDSTGRQIYLQQLLGYRTPRYMHIPVVRNESGDKLSKQTHAPAVDPNGDPATLAAVHDFLRRHGRLS
ncbi:glutamyl-Q tRNA(Asp) synthetase [Bryobacterales bacterium F-183]|nr:glutamyl-Q tRNA(Asp) synthetase [Bryobacterales bacterium F-183]